MIRKQKKIWIIIISLVLIFLVAGTLTISIAKSMDKKGNIEKIFGLVLPVDSEILNYSKKNGTCVAKIWMDGTQLLEFQKSLKDYFIVPQEEEWPPYNPSDEFNWWKLNEESIQTKYHKDSTKKTWFSSMTIHHEIYVEVVERQGYNIYFFGYY